MSLTSLLSIGVSGIEGASSDMEVVGNNIANADTIGFKESRADFANQISQDLIGAGQVGLGTVLQMSQKIMDQGSLVTTGNATDLVCPVMKIAELTQTGTLQLVQGPVE